MTPTVNPVRADDIAWVPIREGLSFRPLHFATDGYSLQLRLEPGTKIARHRHTGEVNALNLEGNREIIDTGEVIGPGTFVYEPPGNVDSWRCVGADPCVIQITLKGRLDYLDEADQVIESTDVHSARALYLNWCAANGVTPNKALIGKADEQVAPCQERLAS